MISFYPPTDNEMLHWQKILYPFFGTERSSTPGSDQRMIPTIAPAINVAKVPDTIDFNPNRQFPPAVPGHASHAADHDAETAKVAKPHRA